MTAGASEEFKTLIESSLETVTVAAQVTNRAGEAMNTVEQAVTRLTQTLRENARASGVQSAQITQVNGCSRAGSGTHAAQCCICRAICGVVD